MAKTLDTAVKRSFERDVRGLLHLAHSLPLEADAVVEPVPREVTAPQLAFDTGYRIRAVGLGEWIEIVEALAGWHSRERTAVARRAGLLMQVPEYEEFTIRVKVVLLKRSGTPRRLPLRFEVQRGDAGYWVQPQYVPMWLEDPAAAISLGRPAVMPWVTLMREPTIGQLQAAADLIAGDPELVAQYYILGSVYFKRSFLRSLLERYEDMFTPEVVAQTPAGREYGARMRRQGKSEGRTEGMLEGELEMIRRYAAIRFPGVDLSGLAGVKTLEAAQMLSDRLFRAASGAEAAEALSSVSDGKGASS